MIEALGTDYKVRSLFSFKFIANVEEIKQNVYYEKQKLIYLQPRYLFITIEFKN